MSQGSDSAIASRVDDLKRDLDMIARLEDIQLELAGLHVGSEFLPAHAEEMYEAAFAAYGLPVETLEVEEAARRIRARSIALELAGGLERWASNLKNLKAAEEGTRWRHLLSIAGQADPHPLRDYFDIPAVRFLDRGLGR